MTLIETLRAAKSLDVIGSSDDGAVDGGNVGFESLLCSAVLCCCGGRAEGLRGG